MSNREREKDLANRVCDLIGSGPEGDEDRLSQAKRALVAWSGAQSLLIAAVGEVIKMRDNPNYLIAPEDEED